MVLITLGSLRADLVGSLGGEAGWTPELDRFAAEADWQGRAVAASSSPVTSLASLVTGVDPWQHQLLTHVDGGLDGRLPTLAGALRQRGYRTSCHFPLDQRYQRFGLLADFDSLQELGDAAGARAELESLDSPARMVWIHLPEAGFPLVDRRDRLESLAGRPAPSRQRLDLVQLMPYTDPETPMPADLADAYGELYRHSVAWGDRRLGRLLDALRGNEMWSRSLVVVTALLGQELGEQGQALFAQNLERPVLEVPLVIKLPSASPALAEPVGRRVATARLWATVVEAAGGLPAPAHLPSLYRLSSSPLLSGLYWRNGRNHFSAVFPLADGGAEQLLWDAAFADAEPEFYPAQSVQAGARGIRLTESPRRILARSERQFRKAPALTGKVPEALEVRLRHWPTEGGTEPSADPRRRDELAADLRHRWLRFTGYELSPEELRASRREPLSAARPSAVER